MDFKKGKIKKTLISINSILLIIIILFTPLAYYIFNRGYYATLYEDNGVYSILNKSDVLDITKEIFKFFKYESDLYPLDHTIQVRYSEESMSTVAAFGPDEISHLYDVRKLLVRIFILYCGSIILFVIMTFLLIEKNIKNFIRNLGIIFLISSTFMLLFIIILYFLGENFPVLFDNFHMLFFPQGNYAFPGGSLIITLFPSGFFYNFFIRLVLSSTIISVVLLVIGIIFTNIFKFVKKYRQ
ncbi:MAG: DUF1461 domain-containing protein [Actinobacteria bacterium]|nr:DUF1461 domain-containing protein [Actinomycetota bacterium]